MKLKRKNQRLMVIGLAGLFLMGAVALALTALQENITFFVSPGEIAAGKVETDRRFRLGGLVEEGSVMRPGEGQVMFDVGDGVDKVTVAFNGLLPDLFREGQGIVAQGMLNDDGVFVADEVLAKHDEQYMPAEVAEALKKSGHWQDDAEEATN